MVDSPFLKQLAGAALIMGGLIGGLSHWGKRAHESPAGPAAESTPAARTALSLVPARAWLVIELQSSLVNALPFAGEGPPCSTEAAPERVVFAVVPRPQGTGDPSFLLGAPGVSEGFFACARKKILATGGQERASAPGLDRLDSPSGVLLRRGPLLLFSTASSDVPELEGLLRGSSTSAARSGPHGAALASLNAQAPSPLALSLELPGGWLTQMDPEFERSPLRALLGATLSLTPSGGARGLVRCQPSGCAALHAFGERALADLLKEIPASLRPRFAAAIELTEPSPSAPAELGLTVTPAGVELGRYLLGSWGEIRPHPLNP